jgi:GntR family transcriptional repressor for pyruvate dehydrogenase complex
MFVPIERKVLSIEIADRLEELILSRQFELDEKLPSEKVLSEQFRVGRNVIREGIKSLHERGLIRVIAGKGSYVVRPEHQILSDNLLRLTLLGGLTLEQIYEIRLPIEVSCAGYAAERATTDQIEKLRGLIALMPEKIEDKNAWCETDFAFHLAVAEASGNVFFVTVLSPFHNLFLKLFADGYAKGDVERNGFIPHKRVFESIRDRNREEAQKAMEDHILNSKRVALLDHGAGARVDDIHA